MSELMGIDMPEFQLTPARREWLRDHGGIRKYKTNSGKTAYYIEGDPGKVGQVVDDDGTIIYYGTDIAVLRERGMEAIEATPAWVLRAIMQHAAGTFRNRDTAVWPETVWDVKLSIKQVFINNLVDDSVMPLSVRKDLANYGSPLVSRFLIRENPEYGETHFIGIRRSAVKNVPQDDRPEDMTVAEWKKQFANYGIDDYLFPELRDMTADAVTAPSGE